MSGVVDFNQFKSKKETDKLIQSKSPMDSYFFIFGIVGGIKKFSFSHKFMCDLISKAKLNRSAILEKMDEVQTSHFTDIVTSELGNHADKLGILLGLKMNSVVAEYIMDNISCYDDLFDSEFSKLLSQIFTFFVMCSFDADELQEYIDKNYLMIEGVDGDTMSIADSLELNLNWKQALISEGELGNGEDE